MKKTKIALWIVLGVLILALFTAEIVGLSKYQKKRYETAWGIVCEQSVIVIVKKEYTDKFLSEEYTAKDFKWSNIDFIDFSRWEAEGKPLRITVYLKSCGFLQANDAVDAFKKLPFVSDAQTYKITMRIQ